MELIIQRKSINVDACKKDMIERETRCLPSLDKTSDERLSRFCDCPLFC